MNEIKLEQKKEIWKGLAFFCKIILLYIVIFGLIQGFIIYNVFQEQPQKEFNLSAYSPMPPEYINKVHLINYLRATILAGVLFCFVLYYLKYKIDPGTSWISLFVHKEVEEVKK